MIASLRGTVVSVTGAAGPVASLIVEVGGVGYLVSVTPRFALSVREGGEVLVHTALIVREDELSLCGFATRDELAVFDLLRGVSGVGPRSALGVLAAMSPAEIAAAVAVEDDAAFRRVSGIGPKTAKLITVSLAGKLAEFAASSGPTSSAVAGAAVQARVALEGLGFAERRVADVVAEIVEADPAADAQSIIRQALPILGPAVVR